MFFIRRVVGKSMEPKLRAGTVIVVNRFAHRYHPGQVVVVEHDGKEKVKRIERIEDGKFFVIGDNLSLSTDSREFGWLTGDQIKGRVIWPMSLGK